MQRTFLAFLALTIAMPAEADWAALSPEELEKQSELIVVGEFLGSERVKLAPESPVQNLGTIRVDAVLKGDVGRKSVFLLLPMPRPDGLVASADIRIQKGQRGLWYLKLKSEGLYQMDHPNRFVPQPAADARIRAWKSKP